jgi:hypothetical protein
MRMIERVVTSARIAVKIGNQYVPQQMEAPLPVPFKSTVSKARASYIQFNAQTNAYFIQQLIQDRKLTTVLGYGGNF